MMTPPPPVRGEHVLKELYQQHRKHPSIRSPIHRSIYLKHLARKQNLSARLNCRAVFDFHRLEARICCSISATTPDTNGVAIEVPSLDSYPSFASSKAFLGKTYQTCRSRIYSTSICRKIGFNCPSHHHHCH